MNKIFVSLVAALGLAFSFDLFAQTASQYKSKSTYDNSSTYKSVRTPGASVGVNGASAKQRTGYGNKNGNVSAKPALRPNRTPVSKSGPRPRPAKLLPKAFAKCRTADAEYFQIAPGVEYFSFYFDNLFGNGNQIYFLKIDLENKNNGVHLAVHHNIDSPVRLQRTSDVAAQYNALAALNGTFFNINDQPHNPWYFVKMNGKKAGNGGGGSGGIAFNDDLSSVYVGKYNREVFDKSRFVICGHPLLIDNGTSKFEDAVKDATERHPRTFVGTTPDNYLFFVVCEGRRKECAGMNNWEMMKFLEMLGCDNGFNLDGGGSSTMVVREEAMSNKRAPIQTTRFKSSQKKKAKPMAVKMVSRSSDGPKAERAVVNQVLILDDNSYIPLNIKNFGDMAEVK